jgi:hypothetical protein
LEKTPKKFKNKPILSIRKGFLPIIKR